MPSAHDTQIRLKALEHMHEVNEAQTRTKELPRLSGSCVFDSVFSFFAVCFVCFGSVTEPAK